MADNPLVSDATFGRVVKSTVDLGVPGFSLYMDNEIAQGAVHTIAGLAAGIVLGPVGVLLVGANSISRSTSGLNLWERGGSSRRAEPEVETRPKATKH